MTNESEEQKKEKWKDEGSIREECRMTGEEKTENF
jgi:hypothetical protein